MTTTIPIILTVIPSLLCQEVLRVTLTARRARERVKFPSESGKRDRGGTGGRADAGAIFDLASISGGVAEQ